MIEVLHGLPPYVAAFRATGVVTRNDYHQVINPIIKSIADSAGKINYLLVLNTPLKNYTPGAWVEDGLLGFRYFSKWKKLAIVTEKDGIKKFTDTFGIFIPCPTKGFMMEDIGVATKWVSEF
jgi:hypothetical protein